VTKVSLGAGEVHVWVLRGSDASPKAALRRLLGSYLGEEPDALGFVRGPGGKPALASSPRLRFNLSHSGSLALVALAADREVGIDVERLDPTRASAAIVDTVFSPREAAILRPLRGSARTRLFFSCWTRKEACAKATGEGVAALERLDVLGRRRVEGLWLSDLDVDDGYAAALAVVGRAPTVRLFRLGSEAAVGARQRPPRSERDTPRRRAKDGVEHAA
jgi:4'-phosphopantetheinyl transferase